MKVVKIATAAAMTLSLVNAPIHVFADQHQQSKVTTTVISNQVEQVPHATVNKFSLYGNDLLHAYNETFKMANVNITSITNNGGNYPNSQLEKAIDGEMNTHWETGRANSATFTNEVTFNFDEKTSLNRIVYAARQSGAKGKGFAQEFEIYRSSTNDGDDFTLVTSGEYKGSTGDIVEIQFAPADFKRLKFVYKKANQNWASAAEIGFYKEDAVSEKMATLFTDDTFSAVSEEFNSAEAIHQLTEEVKNHPLYPLFKEDLENAYALINQGEIEATTAATQTFSHFANEDYSKLYRMDYENIKSIRNNAGHYSTAVIGNAIDGNLDTYWETNKANSASFSNEVEVEFKEAVKLNRIMYGARNSDRKGFAEEFEIYASGTSTGDTYQHVATGRHGMISGLIEAKFEPTTFKRVKFKFKKSNQNWATLNELAFYKEDVIQDKVNSIFTDGTMSALVPEFNNIDQINALENEAKEHPLYNILKERLDLAKSIVNGELAVGGTIVEAEQRGDMVKHAKDRLKFGFGNNLQPTGFAAQPGDKITVYVDADTNGPLPKLAFAQQEGSFANWRREVTLSPGKNEITVPKVNKDNWYKNDITPGGSIYISNPYTKEQQGKAPKIRFEGAIKIPFATKGTDVAQFKTFLQEYKMKIDEDIAKHPNKENREVLDVFEFVSDHIVWTGTATGAYKTYIENGYSPLQTIESYNTHMEEIFNYYGLDARSESHDPKFIRENVRLAQPFGYMYAYTDHIGIQGDVMANLLLPFEVGGPNWGLTHEIGHRMDMNARLYGEVTNNMLPQYMSAYYGKIDQRIPYEAKIYKNVIEENLKDYISQDYFEKLSVFWQLEMLSPGYWAKLNSLYRERDVQLTDGEFSKQQYLVEFSSEVVGLDLSEHFARHGFIVSDETRKLTSKYKKPEGKTWYLNNSVVDYKGKGIQDKKISIGTNVLPDAAKNINKLNFTIDKSYAEDFLGFEVIRDGKVIGFTATNSFEDTNVDTTKNYSYQIVVYDKKLKASEPVEFNSFKPTIAVEDQVTLKLNEQFDPMDYVKALSFEGKDITKDIVIKSNNVDVTKKGNYEIVYEVKNADITATKTTNVTVTSDFTYISDMEAKLANIQYGGLKKDVAPSGKAITLLRQGLDATYTKGIGAHANSEVVYDIEGKGFNFFESYIGIDQAMKGRPSSATFEVWVDDEKMFGSDVFKANTEHEFIKVPVAGAKEVKLITTDANNGNASDHTVWADAKFTVDSSQPTLNVFDELTFVKLNSDFDFMQNVEAFDAEDGNLIEHVKVTLNDFNVNKTGTYTVQYSVTDSDGHTVTQTREIYVYSDATFASDTEWKSAQTAWKTVNKDKSSSGGSIKILVNGETKEFAKGIGTHANSEIVYDLEGKNYDYFEMLVGVDQNIEANTKSSVTFKVLADGKEVFNSGVMKYDTEAKAVKIPVKDVKQLTLIASDSGNGNQSDHADFADAKFYISNGLPQLTIPKSTATKVGTPIDINEEYSAMDAEDGDLTAAVQVTGIEQVNFDRAGKYEITYTVTDSDGNEITMNRTISVVNMDDYNYVSDFDWTSTQNSYTAPRKDVSVSGNTLRLTGEDGSEKSYEKGIGAHSNSTIVYDLTDKDADYFTSFVGVDRQMYGTVGSVVFQVFVDGEMQFDSGLMNSRDPQKFTEVNISGAGELKLVVTDGGNGNGSDHATWGDAKLHFANANSVWTQHLKTAIEEAKSVQAEDYTEESIAALQASITQAEAILANKKATQSEVDEAVEMLKQAQQDLVSVYLDTQQLIAALEAAKSIQADGYTEESISVLQASIAQAEAILANKKATQSDVDEVVEMLKQAQQDLVSVYLDTQQLIAAIEAAKSIEEEDYTEESMATLQASIARAEAVLANNQSTQTDIDQAVEMLKQAEEALIAIDMSQIITIPDQALSTYIKQTLDITGDITLEDMYKLTSLTTTSSRTERVTDLEGLQYAENLITLDITGNEVTDFSPLQGLKKLENLMADPQVIEMPAITGQDSIFTVENVVKGLDGKHVNPSQIAIRHNQTFEEVVINVDDLEANADQYTIDLTEEDKGLYTLYMVYEVEGNSIQIISMIEHQ
ncbi:NPCBM/NEW2 domain-containing protein [Solibacillus sp. FSL K6-1523]|uniref:NPCBM/NEW2 domain-containing protein n=1 Tax=Solibacillus sp. FSL K6-1523 TaxID=2921471 RepID=UPI0030FB47EC